jgi:sialic acid synthase SpsE
VLRPGHRNEDSALHPREYFRILNSKASRDIPPLTIIKSGDLEGIVKRG